MACATLKRSLDLDPLHSPRPSKRLKMNRRYAAIQQENAASCSASQSAHSVFSDITPKVDPDYISNSIREEIRRLHRRRQLHTTSGGSNDSTMSGNTSPSDMDSLGLSLGSSKDKDKPLFTFRQVGFICERMIREREENLKQAYEKVLASKLIDQYDTFVKFTYDQIQKRFENENAPSYLS